MTAGSVAGTAGWVAASTGETVLVVLVLLGAVPMFSATVQYVLVGFHRYRDHYDDCAPYLPRVAVLVPAWNEALVIGHTIDRLMGLNYPAGALRVFVVDDASTDDTPDVILERAERYPGRVTHLRRERGGDGKSHTLNHGLAHLLSDDWMEAMLVIDADVIYAPSSLRRMTRHLADPRVGAVTAYITEGSRPGNSITRFIAYEYVTAQGAARRAQNVLGAMACLAGGAQLHSRANLLAIGGRIDTTTFAEDTVTTFATQLNGRRALMEPNAIVYAEEPGSLHALWKQRMRWARGNVQVSWRYRRIWFRPARLAKAGRAAAVHEGTEAGPRPVQGDGLGGLTFALLWFSTLLLPALMILSSTGLIILFFANVPLAWRAFHLLWITNALCFVFTTVFAMLVDTTTARRVWLEAFFFPGLVSLLVILYSCFPPIFAGLFPTQSPGVVRASTLGTSILLFAFVWPVLAMILAYLVKLAESNPVGRVVGLVAIYIIGFGPFLCCVTFAAYVLELRGTAMTWDKTEKTGKVAA